MSRAKRVKIDCRDFPNDIYCTLLVTGNIREVMKVSLRHAVEDHGHKDTKELRKQIRAMIKTEK